MMRYRYDRYSMWPKYVPVAERKAKAEKEAKRLRKKGQDLEPVSLSGRTIASSFWGKAWCDNLESYSDFSNRIGRGRSYVRNGSVLDLKVSSGKIAALVAGSSLYTVEVKLKNLKEARWKKAKQLCSGSIGSVIELLQGKLSKDVMAIITCKDRGLFPEPSEITMNCSCPDYATMCKHVAAVLYGVGARLDSQPELLFTLRGVNHIDLVSDAVGSLAGSSKDKAQDDLAGDLSDIFGIEIEGAAEKAVEKLAGRKMKVQKKDSREKLKSKPTKKKTAKMARKSVGKGRKK